MQPNGTVLDGTPDTSIHSFLRVDRISRLPTITAGRGRQTACESPLASLYFPKPGIRQRDKAIHVDSVWQVTMAEVGSMNWLDR